MRNVNLEKWRGKRDPVAIDPATVEFRAQGARSCRGCAFDAQWVTICHRAAEEAAKRGLPDCATGVIYVAVERDPRQIALIP